MVIASVQSQIGDYLSALLIVYIIILLAHIITQLLFNFGARPPYAQWSDAILSFLREVSEPYLRLFRKVIPPLGAVDLSPTVAIIVLIILQEVVARVLG